MQEVDRKMLEKNKLRENEISENTAKTEESVKSIENDNTKKSIPEKKIIKNQDEFPTVQEVDKMMNEKHKELETQLSDKSDDKNLYQTVSKNNSGIIDPFSIKSAKADTSQNDLNKRNLAKENMSHHAGRKKHSAKKNEHMKYVLFTAIAIIIGILLPTIINRSNTTADIFNKAISYQKDKEYKKAIKNYYEFYEKSSDAKEKIKALYYIGLCYYSEKQYNPALKIFSKISELDISQFYSGVSLYWIGVVFKHQGIYNKSIEHFNQMIVKYPDNPMIVEGYKNILEIKIKMSDWNTVIDICKTLLSFKDANIEGDIYYYLGLAYEQLKFYEAADKYYRILVDNTNYDPAYIKLARQKLYDRISSSKNSGDTEIQLKNIDE